MTEKEFMDADYEVIDMVNKCHKYGHGPGGELPTIAIPANEAAPEDISAESAPELSPEEAAALDERIQNVRNAMPLILFGAIVLFAFVVHMAL